jgi:hypothetical protein
LKRFTAREVKWQNVWHFLALFFPKKFEYLNVFPVFFERKNTLRKTERPKWTSVPEGSNLSPFGFPSLPIFRVDQCRYSEGILTTRMVLRRENACLAEISGIRCRILWCPHWVA